MSICPTCQQHVRERAPVKRMEKASLEAMLSRGLRRSQIAYRLHVARSTVTRAIKRFGLAT